MSKLRIAIFAERLYGGGVERILQTVLRNFDYDSYDVCLYSSYAEKIDPAFYPEGIKNIGYFTSCKKDSAFWQKIWCKAINKLKLLIYYHFSPRVFYRLFIHRKFDICIAFLEGYATRIASGAHKSTKKIAWLHTDIINYHWTDVAFRSLEEEKDCYKSFSDIVCVAESVKKNADRYLQIEDLSTVIYNPIDRDRLFKLSDEKIKGIDNLKKHKFQLLIVGTLNKNKGQIRLLHILSEMVKKDSEIGLWIVGDGEYRDLINETISDLGLESNVEMLGYQNNPYPFFKRCDVYVCASYAEGFNTAITEALILGIPVVSTLCSGVREQLGADCEYGLIADNNEDSLRDCIERIKDPHTLNHYREKSKERGLEFCISRSMSKIESLLKL